LTANYNNLVGDHFGGGTDDVLQFALSHVVLASTARRIARRVRSSSDPAKGELWRKSAASGVSAPIVVTMSGSG